MKKLAVFLCVCFSCFCFVANFSGLSLDGCAYDLPSGTTHISSDTLVSWLGNTLSAQYVGTDLQYHATTARRVQTTESIVSSDMDGYTSNLYNGRTMAWYVVDIPSADVFTAFAYAPIVTIDFNLHFQNVTYADFGFADYVSNKYLNVSYATCQPYCYLDYNYQGQYNKLYNPPASGTYSGHLGTFGTALSPNYGTHYGGGIVQLSGASSDLYLGTVSACCLGNFDGGLIVGISLLDIVLNDDYVLSTSAPPPQGGESGGGDTPSGSGSSSGVVTGTVGEQNVNITVEYDNSGLISGLLEGIKNLFIPSDEQLQAFTDDMRSIADEHLGGLSEAVEIIDTSFKGIDDITARESITVDTLRIPLLGSQEFLLGGWTIPLKPSTSGGFAVMYTAIALLADFFAAFAFLKMCRNKLEIILNPDSEVVESGS